MTITLIICTYNRPNHVVNLVNQIFECNFKIEDVIVVDSSDSDNIILTNDSRVKYVKSDRKCQPYQRFLGTKFINSDCVLFLDDDIQIIKKNVFEKVISGFELNDEIVGVSVGINYQSGVPIYENGKGIVHPKTGKISWLGHTTGLPEVDTYVEYFPGPIMAFRKKILKKLFDEYTFLIFEKGIAMGEDKAISMRASKFGKLFFFGSEKYLFHPPEPSTYYQNHVKFTAKTTFSRLWISKVYAQTHNKPLFLAYIYFTGYLIKQLFTSVIQLDSKKLIGNLIAIKYLMLNAER